VAYFDVVKTKFGDEYAVEAVRAGAPIVDGLRTALPLALAITLFRMARGAARRWKWEVRVRPWPGPSRPRRITHLSAADQAEAEALAEQVADSLVNGRWLPGRPWIAR
jgi:hypothetical protein